METEMAKQIKKTVEKRIQKSSETEKLVIIFTHLAGIFFSFIPALIVYLVAEGSVKSSVKHALNWQISLLIYSGISLVLIFALVGIFFLWALGIVNTLFCIIAAIKASQNKEFVYPLSIRFIKG